MNTHQNPSAKVEKKMKKNPAVTQAEKNPFHTPTVLAFLRWVAYLK